jgi:hypothetical protein
MTFKTTLNSVEGHQVGLISRDLFDPALIRPLISTSVAHKIYGVPQTINSANYVYFLAMNELFQLEAGSSPSTVSTRVLNVEGPQNNITPITLYNSLSQACFL